MLAIVNLLPHDGKARLRRDGDLHKKAQYESPCSWRADRLLQLLNDGGVNRQRSDGGSNGGVG